MLTLLAEWKGEADLASGTGAVQPVARFVVLTMTAVTSTVLPVETGQAL